MRTKTTWDAIHGRSKTRLYRIWAGMKARCYSPKASPYPHYGGRGIRVCDGWLAYLCFEEWALQHGYAPTLSLDRIDTTGDYLPSNCRWTDMATQSRNKRSNVMVEYRGRQMCATDAAALIGVTPMTVLRRTKKGHPPDYAPNR